ncbi:MAG: hypothetical protein OEU80_02755 [Deltaproteobacteria bacterium]|jgi:hypothetical protein|nr:hypothetical protein [Deltaproteobacteria bacterium]PNV85108.1 MAG: hypothetical protein C0610_13520 [Desulfobacteraceae bacterium]MDH3800990.1 hypothetical protein [Deltaproteobacteria bacterium]MDH3851163.1 hypothetical protein [Deltaproteobacteria bacterium]MDH3897759.1 hypothetical protein [Deltaproteobacteria bacterium]
MSNQGELYDSLESIVAKLYVLRDSCTGIMHTEKSNPNLIWFRGAETLLQEAVDGLQKALGALETGEAVEPPAAEDTEEEGPTETDDEQEESSSEEDE